MLHPEEEETFNAYQRVPSPDHLSHLLGLHQGRAFNLCFQVLGRREDAEDAAQEALIKIVECMPRIENSTTFRSWLYRICLTHALDIKRGIRRRQTHESRFAMNSEASAPAPDYSEDERRTALLKALERIEDDQRNLIVEHYFERTPITQLAAREGISSNALWKRIERARRDLKQELVTLGTAALVPDPSSLLEACQPSVLSTNLVPGVMAKVTAPSTGTTHVAPSELCKGTVASATKVLALGGMVMTAKQSTWITVAVSVAALLGILLFGGFMFRARGPSPSTASTRSQLKKPGTQVEHSAPAERASAPVEPSPRAHEDRTGEASPLKTRLEQYRKKLDQAFPDRALFISKRWVPGSGAWEYLERLQEWKKKELAGMRELIFSEPAILLDFLQSAATGDYIEDLMVFTVPVDLGSAEFSRLPKVLADGLLEMLRSGTSGQKNEILRLSPHLDGKSDDFANACRALLSDPDWEVQFYAARQLSSLTQADTGILCQLAQNANKPELACVAVQQLARRGQEFEDFLFGIVASTSNRNVAQEALWKLAESSRNHDSAFQQRMIDSIGQEIARRLDRQAFRHAAVLLLRFPPAKALPVLDQAAALAPSADWAEGVRAVAAAMRSGKWNGLREMMPAE